MCGRVGVGGWGVLCFYESHEEKGRGWGIMCFYESHREKVSGLPSFISVCMYLCLTLYFVFISHEIKELMF